MVVLDFRFCLSLGGAAICNIETGIRFGVEMLPSLRFEPAWATPHDQVAPVVPEPVVEVAPVEPAGVLALLLAADEIMDVPPPVPDHILPTPVFNPETYQVTIEGTPLGRIKPMHENTRAECLSVYCRRHKCAPPLPRAHRAPPVAAILGWFESGLEIPLGEDNQEAHMRQWREMMANIR